MLFAPFVPLADDGLYVFAYQHNESNMRESQVQYFARSRGIGAARVQNIVFDSYDNLRDQLNLFLRPVYQFYLMVHGAMTDATMDIYGVGKTVNEILTGNHNFFYPRNVPAFEFNWIYCGSVHNPTSIGDAIFARMFGTTFNRRGSVTFNSNNQKYAVTINIPNNDGYIHSGLNPEVLHDGNVQQIAIQAIRTEFPYAENMEYY